MKKIIFLGSKPVGHRCLESLIQHQESLDYELVGVLTNNNKRFGEAYDIPELCREAGIPLIESLAAMVALDTEIDLLISVQYHEILKAHHIEKAKQLAINLHMAPLPEYRGCNQFSFAIVNQSRVFGTTIHRMEPGIDNGAIIFEDRFDIPEDCTVASLYDLTVEKSVKLFQDSLPSLLDGSYQMIPQEDLVAERGTQIYYRKDIAKIKEIDLNWDAEKIARHVRATYMPGFPPPFAIVNGKKLNLTIEE